MTDKRTRVKNADDLWYKALTCTVLRKDANNYEVASPSGAIYDVRIEGSYIRTCNCMAGQNNPMSGCSHVVAASKAHLEKKGYKVVWLVPAGFNWREQGADGVFSVGPRLEMIFNKTRDEEFGEINYEPEDDGNTRSKPAKANWFDSF